MDVAEIIEEFEEILRESETMPWGNSEILYSAAVDALRQFDLAESIIKQQQLEIEALKDEVAEWKMSYENSIRFEAGYGHN